MFATTTTVEFDLDAANGRTVMELVAGDRPGLLSTVGQVFIDLNVDIETAKIMTIGERAEDVFYIVDEDDNPLSEDRCNELKGRLLSKLGSRN